MANSLPFNAVAVDGEYDRVYKAEDWAWYFATFIANGIFPKPSDGLQVVAYSGMEIYRQAVRHSTLTAAYVGSNPTSPVKLRCILKDSKRIWKEHLSN